MVQESDPFGGLESLRVGALKNMIMSFWNLHALKAEGRVDFIAMVKRAVSGSLSICQLK